MGGYGVFKWLLSKPEQFIAGAALSGSLDIVTRLKALLSKKWGMQGFL
jgi:S-formylglutathione hydrolase FrmB